MELKRVDSRLIPLDKSRAIRMWFLDKMVGLNETADFLRASKKELPSDLKTLLRADGEWLQSDNIHVGESGTLYRLLRFASWKWGLEVKFIKEGTLLKREVSDDSNIINLPLSKLLKLDHETSQWATAALLTGNEETVHNPPYKLQVTWDVMREWEAHRKRNQPMPVPDDETIARQAHAFANRIDDGILFIPLQAEDYCFARAFNIMNVEEAESKWPSLAGHESKRPMEMERGLAALEDRKVIESDDHRVVQALAMLARARGWPIDCKAEVQDSVNKSWPQFWTFLGAHAFFPGT